jgi:hypothetical protein
MYSKCKLIRVSHSDFYYSNWLSAVDHIREKPTEVLMNQEFRNEKISLFGTDVYQHYLARELGSWK